MPDAFQRLIHLCFEFGVRVFLEPTQSRNVFCVYATHSTRSNQHSNQSINAINQAIHAIYHTQTLTFVAENDLRNQLFGALHAIHKLADDPSIIIKCMQKQRTHTHPISQTQTQTPQTTQNRLIELNLLLREHLIQRSHPLQEVTDTRHAQTETFVHCIDPFECTNQPLVCFFVTATLSRGLQTPFTLH